MQKMDGDGMAVFSWIGKATLKDQRRINRSKRVSVWKIAARCFVILV